MSTGQGPGAVADRPEPGEEEAGHGRGPAASAEKPPATSATGQQVESAGDPVAALDPRDQQQSPSGRRASMLAAAVTRWAVQVRSASSSGTSAPVGRQRAHAGSAAGPPRPSARPPAAPRGPPRPRRRGWSPPAQATAGRTVGDGGEHASSTAGTARSDRLAVVGGPGRRWPQRGRGRVTSASTTPRSRPTSSTGSHRKTDASPDEHHAPGDAGDAEQYAEPAHPAAVLRLALDGGQPHRRRLGELHRRRGDGPAAGGQGPGPGQQHTGHHDGDEEHDSDQASHADIVVLSDDTAATYRSLLR